MMAESFGLGLVSVRKEWKQRKIYYTDRPRIVHQKDHSVLKLLTFKTIKSKTYEPKITIIAKIKIKNPQP